ncbi:MAG: sugar transferase [Bacteroidaceae bacterium]|nr:sugar transferase [Bacteroidaceae bacterium]
MYLFTKRLFDIIASLIAIICLSWLFIPIIIILACTGEHEIFYKQMRVGKGGELFGVLKFATMLKNSPNMGAGLVTTRNDPRVLPFGKFLRKTKLNELPQLFNILGGSMSVVGPRPMVQPDYDAYTDDAKECYKALTPGLSGIGSIVFRDEEYYISKAKDLMAFLRNVIQPFKGSLEIWYYQNRSIWVDLKIIFFTVWVIICPKSDLAYKAFPTLPRKDFDEEVERFNLLQR